jgi:hypothetical protein
MRAEERAIKSERERDPPPADLGEARARQN